MSSLWFSFVSWQELKQTTCPGSPALEKWVHHRWEEGNAAAFFCYVSETMNVHFPLQSSSCCNAVKARAVLFLQGKWQLRAWREMSWCHPFPITASWGLISQWMHIRGLAVWVSFSVSGAEVFKCRWVPGGSMIFSREMLGHPLLSIWVVNGCNKSFM